MGPDELDMKIEVKRLSRESRRQAERERQEKEKDRDNRQTDRQSDRGEGGQRKTEEKKSSFFHGHPHIVCIADPPKPGKRATGAQE